MLVAMKRKAPHAKTPKSKEQQQMLFILSAFLCLFAPLREAGF